METRVRTLVFPATAIVGVLLAAASAVAAAPHGPPAHHTVIHAGEGGPSDFDTGRSRYTLTLDDLDELQPADGAEAVAALPGVLLQQTNRGAGTPIVRGLLGPQNLLLVDGFRFNTAIFRTGPSQYAALIDPFPVGSIRLTTGPGSVTYGSDAMGGTLDFRLLPTPRAERLVTRARYRFASADLSNLLSASLGGAAGPVSLRLGGGLRAHGRLRTGGGEEVPLSSFLRGDWHAQVGLRLGHGWRLDAAYLGTSIPDAGRADQVGRGSVRFYANRDHFAYAAARYHSDGALRHLRFGVSVHRLDEDVTRLRCDRGPDGLVRDVGACLSGALATVTRRERNRDGVLAATLVTKADMAFLDDRLTVAAGLDGDVETVGSSAAVADAVDGFTWRPKARGTFSDGSTWSLLGAFARVAGRPYMDAGTAELVLSAGARLSHVAASADEVPGLGAVRYASTGAVFDASARVLLGNRLNLYATWAQGARAPNLQEATALGDTGSTFELPNGSLRPERADTLEAGIKLEHPALMARAALFTTSIKDAIVRESSTLEGSDTYLGKPVVRRTTAPGASYLGAEVQLATGRVEGLSLYGDVSYVRGEVEQSDGSTAPARRVPPLHGRLGLRWDATQLHGYVALELGWAAAQDRLASGDRKDLRICGDPAHPGALLDDCAGTPGWTVVGVRGGIEPRPGLRIGLAVNNVLDARYRTHGSGVDAPGIDARLTLAWEPRRDAGK